MLINFSQIAEIALLVSIGEVVILDNMIVDENNYSEFITNTYDS